MYGYLIGALKLGFRHKTHPEWMLSSRYVCAMTAAIVAQRCSHLRFCSHPAEWVDDLTPPLVLHYCQQYHLGREWHFYKYDISAHDALSCEFPKLAAPPRTISGGMEGVPTGDVWLAHTVVMYVNTALNWFKQRRCGGDNWPGASKPRYAPHPDHLGGEYAEAPGGTWSELIDLFSFH